MVSSSPTSPLEAKSPSAYKPFTDAQLRTLGALCDTAFRATTDPSAVKRLMDAVPSDAEDWQRAATEKFIKSSYTDFPNAIPKLLELFTGQLSPASCAQVQQGLDLLGTVPGTALLTGGTGGWLSGKTFADLTLDQREDVLRSWRASSLKLKRDLFKAFVITPLACLYTSEPVVLDAIGYPSPDRRQYYKPLKAPAHVFSFLEPEHLFSGGKDVDGVLNGPDTTHAATQYATVDADVLVIGSGAGGGVTAKVLSDAGYKVLVVEKGVYAPTGEKSRSQIEGFNELYQYGGFFSSEDSSISILAGSVFGGGTAINWSASFRTPHHVRTEWAEQYGLPYFLSDGFAESVDAVCSRMGVSTKHIKHSKANAKLIEGSRKLGYHFDDIPQNTGGNEHSCGWCSFGCPFGEKQGSVETWMVDAAKNGAEFIRQVHIDRLIFGGEDAKAADVTPANVESMTYATSRKKCLGALGSFPDGRKVILRGNKGVVVSGGSINSPSILHRSKIPNPLIGKNLHLHPCCYITGYFPDDQPIHAWDGPIMTAVSDCVINKDGTHYGAKLEVLMSFPAGQAGNTVIWQGPDDHKHEMLRYNNSFSMIVLTRDRDGGEVFTDADGRPRVRYTASKYDADTMTMGVVAGAEIFLAAGATKITTAQAGVESFEVPKDLTGINDPRWKAWVATVKAHGCGAGVSAHGSAHQMGTCRMGTSPSNSVVDPRGRVWHTSNLYVADASVFPTPSGVNPMVTTMSVSHSIARFAAEDMSGKVLE